MSREPSAAGLFDATPCATSHVFGQQPQQQQQQKQQKHNLAQGWIEHLDPHSGAKYYFNSTTGNHMEPPPGFFQQKSLLPMNISSSPSIAGTHAQKFSPPRNLNAHLLQKKTSGKVVRQENSGKAADATFGSRRSSTATTSATKKPQNLNAHLLPRQHSVSSEVEAPSRRYCDAEARCKSETKRGTKFKCTPFAAAAAAAAAAASHTFEVKLSNGKTLPFVKAMARSTKGSRCGQVSN